MDILFLRNEILKNKFFFKFLFEQNSRKNSKKIEKASEKELNILIKILYLICNGKISIKEADFKLIQQSKRLNLFKSTFDNKSDLLRILRMPKLEKTIVLKKFTALYPLLLKTMFKLN